MHGLTMSDEGAGDVWWITAKGFLDASTAEELDALVTTIFNYNVYKIVFVISEITFISSAGAGVLMAAYKNCERGKGEAVFVNPSDSVRTVFKTLGLLTVFNIVPSREAAARHFR